MFATYSAQLVVSVVTNVVDITAARYMQDMTSARCAATATGKEVQLEDSRDGNKYWVGKMKDGKCWMLQNLALDLTTSGLKYSDTNISSNWTSSSTYPPTATSSDVSSSSTSNTAIQSWNFGKWVLATPWLTTDCGNSKSGQNLSNCIKVGFVDVSSSSFSPGYTAATRSWDGANSNSSTLVTVNCTSWSGSGTSKTCVAGTYDAHYLVGNYYSWNAATAGTGVSMTGGEADGSICPKGWTLPFSSTSDSLGSIFGGRFDNLLSSYGISTGISGTVDGVTYNIVGNPLRFVRSGRVYAYYHYVDNAGQYGLYWLSTPKSSASYAYNMNVTGSSVSLTTNWQRRDGFAVRCVAESDTSAVKPPITYD